jgi:hypothetical protein
LVFILDDLYVESVVLPLLEDKNSMIRNAAQTTFLEYVSLGKNLKREAIDEVIEGSKSPSALAEFRSALQAALMNCKDISSTNDALKAFLLDR